MEGPHSGKEEEDMRNIGSKNITVIGLLSHGVLVQKSAVVEDFKYWKIF